MAAVTICSDFGAQENKVHALKRGGPDRDRTPPPAAARGERAGAIGSPSPCLNNMHAL